MVLGTRGKDRLNSSVGRSIKLRDTATTTRTDEEEHKALQVTQGQSDEAFGLGSSTLVRSVCDSFILAHNRSPQGERSYHGSMQPPSPVCGSEARSSQVISAVREYARKLREFCEQKGAIAKDGEEISTSTIRRSCYLNYSEDPSAASSTFQSFEMSFVPVTNSLSPFPHHEVQGSNTQVVARVVVPSTRYNTFAQLYYQDISAQAIRSQRLSTSPARRDRTYAREPDMKIPILASKTLPISWSGSCVSQRLLDLTTTDRQGFPTARELDSDRTKLRACLCLGPTMVFAPTTADCSSRLPSPRAESSVRGLPSALVSSSQLSSHMHSSIVSCYGQPLQCRSVGPASQVATWADLEAYNDATACFDPGIPCLLHQPARGGRYQSRDYVKSRGEDPDPPHAIASTAMPPPLHAATATSLPIPGRRPWPDEAELHPATLNKPWGLAAYSPCRMRRFPSSLPTPPVSSRLYSSGR